MRQLRGKRFRAAANLSSIVRHHRIIFLFKLGLGGSDGLRLAEVVGVLARCNDTLTSLRRGLIVRRRAQPPVDKKEFAPAEIRGGGCLLVAVTRQKIHQLTAERQHDTIVKLAAETQYKVILKKYVNKVLTTLTKMLYADTNPKRKGQRAMINQNAISIIIPAIIAISVVPHVDAKEE